MNDGRSVQTRKAKAAPFPRNLPSDPGNVNLESLRSLTTSKLPKIGNTAVTQGDTVGIYDQARIGTLLNCEEGDVETKRESEGQELTAEFI